jgi:hypothetical protein
MRAKEVGMTPGSFLMRARETGVTPGSFLTRVKEVGVPASFFTRALNAPDEPGSFFGPAAPCTVPRTGSAPPTHRGTGARSRSPRGRRVPSTRRGKKRLVWQGGKLCAAARMNKMVPGSGFIAAASGGRARVAHIYASPCFEVTPRCAVAQSYRRCSYSAREAR